MNHWRCVFEGDALHALELTENKPTNASFTHQQHIKNQLDAFYTSQGTVLPQVPTTLVGTPFQQRVWQYLRTIPAGETRTYQAAAQALGTSPRPIGGACRVNPLPIIFPCHRIVAKTHLGGYMGTQAHTLAIKQALLTLEQESSHATV